MVAPAGPLATIHREPRQVRKEATVVVDSCAGVWLVEVISKYPLSVPCFLSLQYSQIVTDFPCVYGYHAHILSLAGRLEFNELSGTCAEVATTFL